MDLKEKIKRLPSCPGVYLMKDSLGSVIYVGKSKNLKSRVSSYFQSSRSQPPKVVKLVQNLKDFDYKLTDTEFEAFMLECKLIKEMKPIYNKLMKSPKSYVYIRVGIKEKYPEIEITSEANRDDESLHFGPYTNRNTVERGLQGIKECCKILCSNNSRRGSACLNYSLGLCIGMCLEDSPNEEYLAIVDRIVGLLKGSDENILEEMKYNMNSAAESFDFERAARYRDYISAVKYLINKARVVEYTEENKNIAVVEDLRDDSFKLFLIKGNKVLFSERYVPGDIEELKATLKTNIIYYFNNKAKNNSIEVGREDIDEAQIIYSYLKSKSSSCRHVVISDRWLKTPDNINLDRAISKLLDFMIKSREA
ncbi:UvrB/UvrC motif-containing protein [Fonticella tunisiensis]|uniref:Excinuclease ABC subunit C n=1 Tax=Fonticella tunisiensis TaxID=1096341 RepID=A0A4R7KSQ2_9CLOT|nr:UvrB/UvrC motif-containing protein [Fonticella tunisiensis]TDT62836.1 excinuclease ABC subunit C [Fonticella tunisiensis]